MTQKSEACLEDKIEFATAVLLVSRKRHDFNSLVMGAYRDLLSKQSNADPFVEMCALQVGLSGAGYGSESQKQIEAMLQLVNATLHIWYRVPTDLAAMVQMELSERAILRGDDTLHANMTLNKVVNSARSAGSAFSEQKAKSDALAAIRERKRETGRRHVVLVRRGRIVMVRP